MATDAPERFVVCGSNALALRLTGELTERHGAVVTVVTRPGAMDWVPAAGDASSPTVIEAPRLTAEVLRRAGLSDATAVALVDQDDVANFDAALVARQVNPQVRIVARMFSRALADGISAVLPGVTVLSASEIAAPAFVAAALGDDSRTYLRLPDQLLRVADPASVSDPADVLCGLADTAGRVEPDLLPDADADVVLARAYGSPPRPGPRRRSKLPRLPIGRNALVVLAVLAGVLVVGTVVRVLTGDLGLWRSVCLTALAALGGADADPEAGRLWQATELLLVVTGVALVPALTAAVVEAAVRARLASALGTQPKRVSGHVVVVGLGNVGTRVLQELYDFGVELVAVERSADARGIQVARELGVPVVIGDARQPGTLRAASTDQCRTLVVVSVDDLTNLEVALAGRALHREAGGGELPVVLRLFDADMAARVTQAFAFTESRSVSYLAAPAFAAAMAGPEIIDTIPIGRHVLLLAEIPVGAGSDLDTRHVEEVDRPGALRLIGVRTGRGTQTLWHPPCRRRLTRTDRLLVIATRAGLADLAARAAAIPDSPPLLPDIPLARARTIHTPPAAAPD